MNGNGDLEDKYCVSIKGEGVSTSHPHDTMPVLLEADQTMAPLQIFDSIDEAVEAARIDQRDHPKWGYEVRKYLGTNLLMPDIIKYGRWKIGVDILRMV